jgi:hypothetical protein
MEQIKRLSAGQGALKCVIRSTTKEIKSEICAEVKSDMTE